MYFRYFNKIDFDLLVNKDFNLTFYTYLLTRTAVDKEHKPYITYANYRKEIHNDLCSFFDCSTSTITRQFKKLIELGMLVEDKLDNKKVYYFPNSILDKEHGAIAVEDDILIDILKINNDYAMNVYLQLRKLKDYAANLKPTPWLCPTFCIQKISDIMGYAKTSTPQIKKIHEAIDALANAGIIKYEKVKVAHSEDANIKIPYFRLMEIRVQW